MEFLVFLPNLLWPWISKVIFPHRVSVFEILAQLVVVSVVGAAVYYGSIWAGLQDVEILNGFVTGKKKEWVSCEHSYSCNCRNECSGSGDSRSCYTVCDTCYEHTNDWDWRVNTSVTSFNIARIDRRGSKEPPRWSKVRVNDPVSVTHSYTNYILGAPHSLFNVEESILKNYKGMVPAYPSYVYDYHYVDRVLRTNNAPNIPTKDWSLALQSMLSPIGGTYQVNAVVIITGFDSDYAEAVREAWKGGKKNDVVVVVGANKDLQVKWVSIISWTDAELFKVRLRDALLDLGTLEKEAFLSTLKAHIVSGFSRKSMSDFEYLKKEMKPSNTALIMGFLLCAILNGALTFFFLRNDFNAMTPSELFHSIRRNFR